MLVKAARALLRSGPLRQPDRRSCGAAALVFAEMLRNPAYAERVLGGEFATETLAMHSRATGPTDAAGRLQVPWPEALGTPPWAVARHLAARFERRYAVRLVRTRPAVGLTIDECPAALYVGSRWLPRHVVLVVGADAGRLDLFEPSRGTLISLDTANLAAGRAPVAGWRHPWFVVGPSRPSQLSLALRAPSTKAKPRRPTSLR